MIKAIQKLKDRKGFTLVELIVVLVILAILAAMLIPAFTGYIDKAREQNMRTEAEMVLTAAQTVVSEQYGYGNITVDSSGNVTLGTGFVVADVTAEINQLAEISSKANSKYDIYVKVTGGDDYKTVKVSAVNYYSDTEKKFIQYTLGTDGSATWSTASETKQTYTAASGEAKFSGEVTSSD